jgi:hypothetical protein
MYVCTYVCRAVKDVKPLYVVKWSHFFERTTAIVPGLSVTN